MAQTDDFDTAAYTAGTQTDDVDTAAYTAGTQTDDFGTAAYTVGTQTTETLPTDLLPLRELQGLDAALKNIRGAKAVQESKRVALQQALEGFRKDLERPSTSEQADQIDREIQKTEDQIEAVQESIDVLNQQLKAQVRPISETMSRVLD